ncbi:hypothetical protein Tsubulata_003406 [Turnera subulata]|uniref:Reverse transcriptase zinc-binding domain-containing protein n=1 Tax=Turnera subulata TaxID=218843 RepID=A0A9Q0J6T9_9ROSI|nr:hypothetical protein Tsubulata_003406 [Turnera subulata]
MMPQFAGSRVSPVWQNILRSQDYGGLSNKTLGSGFQIAVGSGSRIRFWCDAWSIMGCLKERIPRIFLKSNFEEASLKDVQAEGYLQESTAGGECAGPLAMDFRAWRVYSAGSLFILMRSAHSKFPSEAVLGRFFALISPWPCEHGFMAAYMQMVGGALGSSWGLSCVVFALATGCSLTSWLAGLDAYWPRSSLVFVACPECTSV